MKRVDQTNSGKGLESLVDYSADAAHLERLTFVPADPASARTLRPADVERFNRDGFLRPLQTFDSAETASFRDYIDGLVRSVVSAADRRNSYSISSYHVC